MLKNGPDALKFSEGCFTEVGWNATFESVYQLAGCFYDLVRGCGVQVGDIFVLVEHRGRDFCGPGVLHQHYPCAAMIKCSD